MNHHQTHDPLAASDLEPRADLIAGHAAAWRHVAGPGSWWSGSQRVALAAATRAAWQCSLCAARSQAISPSAGAGVHDGPAGALSPIVVDTVHRLVTDQARLSRTWLEQQCASGELTPASYVELLGVVSLVVSLDVLHEALGVALAPLPEPRPGAPTGYQPAGLAMEEAWVPMILPENLATAEQDLYRHPTGNVLRAMSAVPEEVRALKALSAAQYIAVEQMRDFVGGERLGRNLSRAQMELVAGRVSALHECFY